MKIYRLLTRLVDERIIITGARQKISSILAGLQPPSAKHSCDRLVIGVTGAVQASLIFSYLDQVYFRYCRNIEIVLTKSSLKFINPRASEYLYSTRVWIDLFKPQKNVNVPHIHLAQSADLIVVFPATAHTLHRLATGECSDLLSLVIAATNAPVILVPAMNRAMWFYPPIQRNVSQLREDGFYIVEPGLGYEVSANLDATLQVGGPGVDPMSLVALLDAVLSSERQVTSSE